MKISISGIRGIFGDDLLLDDVIDYVSKFASLLDSKGIKDVIVARDTRYSSKIIQDVAVATLLSYGMNVHNLSIVPTPFLFRASRNNAGLMITSSHNPLEWNGLKFVIDGRGLFEHELSLLLSMDKTEIDIGKEDFIKSSYIEDLSKLNIKSNARVAVDTTGGAASSYAEELLSMIGCKVYSLSYDKPDYPDPTTKDLSMLAALMNDNNCNLGFAYDLDGDRLVVMYNGRKLKPDATLLLALANISYNKMAVSIDTSLAVRDLAELKNSSLIYSKVGEANLIRVMLENDISIGGEGSSGGFVYPKFNLCRDGLLASALIASMDSKEIDEYLALSDKYHIIRTKVAAPSDMHDDIINSLEHRLEEDSYHIDRLDGLKGYIDDNTWILIRSSNTEDIIRLSIESDDASKVKK
ncbi:MAG: phosphomannomutase, partial [Candidatus Nitrosothermus koennekii]